MGKTSNITSMVLQCRHLLLSFLHRTLISKLSSIQNIFIINLPWCPHRSGLSCTPYGTSSCQAYSTVLWPSRWWPSPSDCCRRCCCLRGRDPAVCRGRWRPEGSPYRSRPGQSSQTASPHYPSPPLSLPSSPAAVDGLVCWGSLSVRCGYTLSLAHTVMPSLRGKDTKVWCHLTVGFG